MRGFDDEWEADDAWSDDDYGSDCVREPSDDEGSQGMNQEDLLRKLESAQWSMRSQMAAMKPVGQPIADVTRLTGDVVVRAHMLK